MIKKITLGLSLLTTSILLFSCSQITDHDNGSRDNDLPRENMLVSEYDNAEQLYNPIHPSIAPELSTRGSHTVGVKTLAIVNPNQLDPITETYKDRKLTVEVWYPSNSQLLQNKTKAVYKNQTRRGIPFSLKSNAYRDIDINLSTDKKYPLIVLSHGYTGYRTLMFYIGEHLASHGYIVASIDHTDSTTAEIDVKKAPFKGFFSTLLNRSRDQQFTLDYFTSENHFLSNVIDTNSAGLIGFSMGGYGAINTIGGCYHFNEQTGSRFTGIKDPQKIKEVVKILNSCAGGQYSNVIVDKKWKAALAFAPWGSQFGLFNNNKVKAIKTPIMYIAGDLDDISDYNSIRKLYDHTGSKDKYMLTYENARHNVAPHPAPSASYANSIDMGHYIEPSWSSLKLNNINKHFSLALMDCHVKQKQDMCEYLKLSKNSNQIPINNEVVTPWKGFENRFATGMQWLSNKQ